MAQVSQQQLAELLMSLSTNGLREETALFLAANEDTTRLFLSGANPHGKCAEFIAMCVRNNLHDPLSPWVVVNPPRVPSNYVRSWVNPDPTSARDLLYEVRVSSTRHIFVPGTQVKVGKPAYIARSLLKRAHDGRYCKVCDVDARLVCPDGSPRIAANAFTKGQAESLKKAGFRFVGIGDLEADAKRFHAGLKGAYEQELAAYDRAHVIRASYAPRQVAIRAGIATGMTVIIAAAGASYQHYGSYKQAVRDGKIEDSTKTRKEYTKQAAKTVATKVAISGGITMAGVATEAAAFHAAEKFMPTEKAQTAATVAVAAAYASLDIVDEITAYRRGEISGTEAAICGCIRLAADALPVALHIVAGRAGSAMGTVVGAGIKWGLGHVRTGIRSSEATEAA